MMTIDEPRAFHDRALTGCGALVARAADADLGLPTPCSDWDLGALIGHMVGQNDGFAAAVRDGDAPASAYDAPRLRPDEIRSRWAASVARLREAFGRAVPDARVRLAELDREVSVTTALGMQLLDSAVHAWDVATALGESYRPPEEIVSVVLPSAEAIAARPGGAPGTFAAPREVTREDRWADALRLLGRDGR